MLARTFAETSLLQRKFVAGERTSSGDNGFAHA